ncbi:MULTISPECIES: hypothetical protein [Geobacter]|uniref:Lipoprotein n=1 Tax=Geobacter anodireducens TaxID=1340425 RepID=A0ABR9NRB4_9BACT|nr:MULTISPECIES: hypothetical protein [Geobacter]MBE2886812.1 hypothetical protein [Geobacter anodireducens]HMN03982.1 hypothetical protein [Geobacter anodireducens]
MILKKLSGLLLIAGLLIGGCGGSGGDDLVGGLTLNASTNDLTAGNYQVTATAKYTHPSKDPLGTEIAFNTRVYTNISTLATYSATYKVNSSGEVGVVYPVVRQRSTPIFYDINASTGDLNQFKTVSVPAVSSLAVNPTALSFADTDTVGTAKTLALSGGVTPFSVSSTTADVEASVSDRTVTVILMANPVGPQTATLTITDALGTRLMVPIGY